MSFTGLNYDNKAYSQQLKESKGIGMYHLKTPLTKAQCLPSANSGAQAQMYGASIDRSQPLIDIDSELMGLNRRQTKVYDEKYQPCCDGNQCNDSSGYPCGQGVVDCNLPGLRPGARPQDKNLLHFPDCKPMTDYTRLSHPVCNMRGLGINRWEWLCLDPQERVTIPFDHQINNRIIVNSNCCILCIWFTYKYNTINTYWYL